MPYVTRGRGALVVFVVVMTAMALSPAAQAPPQGRGAAPGQGRGAPPPGRGGGGMGAGPSDLPSVDAAAAGRGRTVYAAQCINCHGTQARGTEKGANLVRSVVVLRDRYGSELGPFLKKGHPSQSAAATPLTDEQITDLANFLRQRVNDSLRGSPIFQAGNVLTGDAKAGAAYFNGDGKCSGCHGAASSLAGIGGRYAPVDLQQRFLFPRTGRGRGASSSNAITVTVTPASGAAVSGVLVQMDDFNVSLRDASGAYLSFKRTPALKVEKTDPLAAHIALLDTITDKQLHDVVAYLETLK
jgi:mono/diheme cytochrome c family protein